MVATTSSNLTKSEELRRDRRRAANRKSARKSRYRELVMLEELQRSVGDLSKKNANVRQENNLLKETIKKIKDGSFGTSAPVAQTARNLSQDLQTQQSKVARTLVDDQQSKLSMSHGKPATLPLPSLTLQQVMNQARLMDPSNLKAQAQLQAQAQAQAQAQMPFSQQVTSDILQSALIGNFGAHPLYQPMLQSLAGSPSQDANSILAQALKRSGLARSELLQQQTPLSLHSGVTHPDTVHRLQSLQSALFGAAPVPQQPVSCSQFMQSLDQSKLVASVGGPPSSASPPNNAKEIPQILSLIQQNQPLYG